jgi:hypothetical protein
LAIVICRCGGIAPLQRRQHGAVIVRHACLED